MNQYSLNNYASLSSADDEQQNNNSYYQRVKQKSRKSNQNTQENVTTNQNTGGFKLQPSRHVEELEMREGDQKTLDEMKKVFKQKTDDINHQRRKFSNEIHKYEKFIDDFITKYREYETQRKNLNELMNPMFKRNVQQNKLQVQNLRTQIMQKLKQLKTLLDEYLHFVVPSHTQTELTLKEKENARFQTNVQEIEDQVNKEVERIDNINEYYNMCLEGKSHEISALRQKRAGIEVVQEPELNYSDEEGISVVQRQGTPGYQDTNGLQSQVMIEENIVDRREQAAIQQLQEQEGDRLAGLVNANALLDQILSIGQDIDAELTGQTQGLQNVEDKLQTAHDDVEAGQKEINKKKASILDNTKSYVGMLSMLTFIFAFLVYDTFFD